MGYGPTPLMRAAEAGNPETVRALPAAGADANAIDWAPNVIPKRDTTALMYAAREGHTEAVKLLLDAGASVNAKMLPYDWTALWLAADGRFASDRRSQRDYAGRSARIAPARRRRVGGPILGPADAAALGCEG